MCGGKEGYKTCQLAIGTACKNSADCAGKERYGASTKCSEADDGNSYCCFENGEQLPVMFYTVHDCCSKDSKVTYSMWSPTTEVCIEPKS